MKAYTKRDEPARYPRLRYLAGAPTFSIVRDRYRDDSDYNELGARLKRMGDYLDSR